MKERAAAYGGNAVPGKAKPAGANRRGGHLSATNWSVPSALTVAMIARREPSKSFGCPLQGFGQLTARMLPLGQERQDAFRQISKFRDKIAALEIAERSAPKREQWEKDL